MLFGKNPKEANIGFVGLGMMGDRMAQNLLRAGFKIKVYDIRPETATNTVAMGATIAKSASELAGCDIVFIIVNTAAQVEEVLLGRDGISKGPLNERELIAVVMSTISPVFLKDLAEKVLSKKIKIVDAPVSGAPVAAQQGTLTFMAGGRKELVDVLRPYFQAMGKNIFHIGELGSGLTMKLINNLIAIPNIFVFPEGLRIGLKAGLDIKTMVEAIRVSTANSWFSEQWNSYVGVLEMLLKDTELHETFNTILIKDVQTAIELGEELGYESPVLKALFPMIKAGVESTGVVTEGLFNEMIKFKNHA